MSKSAKVSAPTTAEKGASAKLPDWYVGYCALAVFMVAVLSLSLWLNHREARALDFAADSYMAYAKVLERANGLGRAAFFLQAPGNDVFSSHDVAAESRRLDLALASVREQYRQLQTAIGDLSPEARTKIAPDLGGFESQFELTAADARAVLSEFTAGHDDVAAQHLAAMNKRFNDLAQHLFGASRFVRSEQFATIAAQRKQANSARNFAATLAVIAVLLAIGAALHGWRVRRVMRMQTLQRERQFQQLSRARDRAEQAARVKAQFLATMSHEIRTPMNGVLGMLDALAATSLSQAQAGILKTANSSADLLQSMIDDVLDFSLIDAHMLSIKNAPVDLCELAQRTLALYATPARDKRLKLRLESPETPIDVLTDATRLSQVLCNFLGNALKFTSSGSVRLCVEVLEEDHAATRVKFSVSDTGIGIDLALQGKLFAPFTLGDAATNRRFGGTGLGLAICKQLSKLLDPESGEVGVVSAPGAGSTFYVILKLPKTAEHAHGGSGLEANAGLLTQKFSGRVLVAEDNETNRQVVVTMLRNLGLESSIAVNGNEAIAAVERENFDLILMDYHMPELDGCDATVGIRRHEQRYELKRTPIVAVTASVLAEDREKCLASGMDDFVAKPLRQKTLASVLEKWLPANSRRNTAAASASFERTWTTLPQDIFDLEQLLEMQGIAGESFDDLLDQFHGSAVDGLATIRNAIESGDAVALKRAAHKLKGAAATLGAKIVAERCHALEVMGKEQRMEAAAEQLHCLEQEYLEARRYMEACAQPKAAPAA
jgi:signal transduction histidine kinase/DNA-binding NarL/FixJ family response regulator/HPt (histidine-containing phosphotransfer) domain-containing protein